MWKRIKVYMGLADKLRDKRSVKVKERAPEENSGVSPKLNQENLLNATNGLMDVSTKYVLYLNQYLTDLEKVSRIVKVLSMVNASPDFFDPPAVSNGCSDLLVEVFGEKGKHARSAIGVASLPGNWPIEIEVIAEITD